jgi:tetratricopeptide (TPR) repeat protein
MYRPVSLTVMASLLLAVVAGCGGQDQPKTTSQSAGATTPTLSGSAPAESPATASVATPVSYDSAEDVFHGGRYAEAAQLFGTYTDSNPENPWGYYMLGLSTWRAGQPEQAKVAFERALQLDSTHRKSLFNSSRVLLELGQPKEALERIEKALSLEPMSSEGLRLLGRVKYQLGDVEGSIEAYRRALSRDDRDVWSMNNLGLIYIEQGKSAEALPPLARAVELKGNSPVFLNNLGTALERAGYPTAAAKAFETAISVDSSYTKASVSLARVTSAGQQPESETVDLRTFSSRFQTEIDAAPGTTEPADSTITVDSGIVSHSSIEAVADTTEDCIGED